MGAAAMKEPQYVRVNDLRARTDAEPPPPDRDRCTRSTSEGRCPRRRTGKDGRRGQPLYCDECRKKVRKEHQRRTYLKLRNNPVYWAGEVRRNTEKRRKQREAGDRKYFEHCVKNAAYQRRRRAEMKALDPEAYEEYLRTHRERQREYRAKRKEAA